MGLFYKLVKFRPGGYLVFGRIHMLDLGFGRPTLPSTKIFCSKPIHLPKLPIKIPIFIFKPLQSTKILNSEPFHLPKFFDFGPPNPSIYQNLTIFLENDPPIFLHRPSKTHPSTSIIRIHENMSVLPPGNLGGFFSVGRTFRGDPPYLDSVFPKNLSAACYI